MPAAYEEDLAYIHDVGHDWFVRKSAAGLLKILRKRGWDEGLVIDLGCGGGVWARDLVDAGYDVVGVDISSAMIRIATERVPEASFHNESLMDFAFPDCCAVTALGEVLAYEFDGPRMADGGLLSILNQVFRTLLHSRLQYGLRQW